MVVMETPVTVEDYEQFLSRESLMPVFTSASSDFWVFRNSAPESKQGRIWNRAVNNRDKSFLGKDFNSIRFFTRCLAEQKCCAFIRSTLVPTVMSNFCAITRSQELWPEINLLSRSDPTATETLSGITMSSSVRFESERQMFKYFGRCVEHAVLEKTFRMGEFSMSANTGSRSVAECYANRVITPERKESLAPDLIYFSTLFKILIGSCAFSACFLLYESMGKCVNRPTVTRDDDGKRMGWKVNDDDSKNSSTNGGRTSN